MIELLARLRRWLSSRRVPPRASSPPRRQLRLVYGISASTKLIWFSGRLVPGQIVVIRGRNQEAVTIVDEVWADPEVAAGASWWDGTPGYCYRVVRGMAGTLPREFRRGDSVTVVPPRP